MPNYITNIIKFDDENLFNEFSKKYISKNENEELTFDFNNVVPMPKSLDIDSSSAGRNGHKYLINKEMYATFNKEYLLDVIRSNAKLSQLYNGWNLPDHIKIVKVIDSDPCLFSMISNLDVNLGKQYLDNLKKYGAENWYEWSKTNWGTKWNSGDVEVDNKKQTIHFTTAWSVPTPIFEQILNTIKTRFSVFYADEGSCFAGELRCDSKIEGDEPYIKDFEYNEKENSELYRYRVNLIVNNNLEDLAKTFEPNYVMDEKDIIDF